MIGRRTVLGWLAGITATARSGFASAFPEKPSVGLAGAKLEAPYDDFAIYRLKAFTKAFESLAQSVYYPAPSDSVPAYEQATASTAALAGIFLGCTYYSHQYVCGDGVTAIEAVDDWYSQMPKGFAEAIIWRVEPEIDKRFDFCTEKTTYRVISRFAIVPLGTSL